MGERALCVLIGYLCGGILAAELLVRRRTGRAAREFGNPGTAGVAARFGARFGALVLLGDVGKTALAACVCALLVPGPGRAALLWAGLGCALGHDFPALWRFRGGKGVAVTCAAAVFFSWAAGGAACLLGLLAVLASRYLAVGAAVIAAAFPALTAVFGFGAESALAAALLGALMLARFAPSFGRIARGEEKKTDLIARFIRR